MNIDCNTVFKSSTGVTVSVPLSDGYVEVTFTFDENTNISTYNTYFEAVKQGSNKKSAVLLDSTLISSTLLESKWRVETIKEVGTWEYLSNLSLKYESLQYSYVLNEDGGYALNEDGSKIIDYQY